MKKYIFSVHPKYAYLILNGRKTMDIRKAIPNEKEPYEMLIYVTKKKSKEFLRQLPVEKRKEWEPRMGKVAGKVTVYDKKRLLPDYVGFIPRMYCLCACLKEQEILEYAGENGDLYGLFLEDPQVFEQPREITDYSGKSHKIKRPPESWCGIQENIDM